MDHLIHDLRYAVRRLGHAPAFTTVAVLSLALGIGANTAIFSIVNAVLIRDMPARSPDRLVELFTSERSGYQYSTFSYPDFRDVRDQATVFQDVAARYAMMLGIANEDGTSDVLWGEVVTGNLFELLGVDAAVGRALRPEDDAAQGASPVAVISHGLWNRRFGSDPGVVGETVRLNGRPVTIVGVMSEGFTGQFPGFQMDLWVPHSMAVPLHISDPDQAEARGSRNLFPVARLEPGATLERARAELETIALRLGRDHPDTNDGRTMTLLRSDQVSFNPIVDQALVPVAVLLMVVVGLVLAIACANLASLLLIRATGRRREIATRLAVGAGRGRLIRQLLTESVVLALAGGLVGLALAYALVQAITGFTPPVPIPVNLDLGLDTPVLVFTFALSLVTGILFGLAPALRASRPDVLPAVKDAAYTELGKRRRFGLRNALVVGQVVVSLLLLVTAGLFVRSLNETQRVDAGFDTERLAIAALNLGQYGYTLEEGRVFVDRLVERVEALPDVRSACITNRVPVGISIQIKSFLPEGWPVPEDGNLPEYDYTRIDERYFETMGVAIVRGRAFTRVDRTGPEVAIVSETAARRFWPGEDPIGKRIRNGSEGPWHEVVGVARDTKVRTLGEAPRPYVYLPLSKAGTDFATIVVATRGDPAAFMPRLREEIRAIDPAVTPFTSGTIQEQLAIILYPARMGAILLAAFGALALALAVTGLYGVVSYTASRRTREVGIRMAMGARPTDITGMVIRNGAGLVAVGIALGLALAFVVTRLLAGFLYGVSVTDPVTFLGIPLLLGGIALLASWIPARRAARLDPMRALRYE